MVACNQLEAKILNKLLKPKWPNDKEENPAMHRLQGIIRKLNVYWVIG